MKLLPVKFTIYQFTAVMLFMIFWTVTLTLVMVYNCDYWQQSREISTTGLIAVILEAVVLLFGAMGMTIK